MEWWKLFSGTFILIFLAELGDKTQLAAMAKTADSPDNSMAKWVVFLGASAALVSSTFIAVFLGHILKTVVPDERYIKIAAGSLFLIFGSMILYETIQSYRSGGEEATQPVVATAGVGDGDTGFVGGLALAAAMDFESLSVERYRRFAAESDPQVARVLLDLAREEEGHLARLRGLPEEDRQADVWDVNTRRPGTISDRKASTNDILERLIRHEEASAAFYRDLAGRTLIPSVRSVLSKLADEESAHAKRLRGIHEA